VRTRTATKVGAALVTIEISFTCIAIATFIGSFATHHPHDPEDVSFARIVVHTA